MGTKRRRPQCRRLRRRVHRVGHELPGTLHGQFGEAQRPRPAIRRCGVRSRRRAAQGRCGDAVVPARRVGQGQGTQGCGRSDGTSRHLGRARHALGGHLRRRRRRRSRHRHQRVRHLADGARQQPDREDPRALPRGEADWDHVESQTGWARWSRSPPAGPRTRRSIDGNSGYLSHSLYPLYFGLGAAEAVDGIEVLWPSGKKQIVQPPFKINSRRGREQ